MATLKDKLDEMARIKAELQRMETSEETTEENDGDYRDSLVDRWKQLDEESKPIIERMERIKAITRTADDEGNLERPAGEDAGTDGAYGYSGGPAGVWHDGGAPGLGSRGRFRNPYEDLEAVRHHVVRSQELRGRAFDAIEMEAKRGNLGHDFAEEATRKVQENSGTLGRGLAEHILLTGSDEYQEAFRSYLEDPQGMAQRAALSLTLANGGYLLPFVLDQVPVP